MPVSRKRKTKSTLSRQKNKKNPKPYAVVKHQYHKMQNNIFPDNLSYQDRLNVIIEIGNNAANDFESDFIKLKEFFSNYDPLYLMSFSVFYFLAHREGIDEEAIKGKLDFPPYYVEVIQALSLFQERPITRRPLLNESLGFQNIIKSLNLNQSYRYFQLAKQSQSAEDLHSITLRTEMMNHTLAVRNWAYEPQMQKVAFGLAENIQIKFEKTLGFNPIAILEILFKLTDLTNERLNSHLEKLRVVFRSKNNVDVFKSYEMQFSHIDKISDDGKKEIWDQAGHNLKYLKHMVMTHADITLAELFTFDIEELMHLTDAPLEKQQLEIIMDQLSFEFGELRDYNKDHIFLNNPIHQKPFIKTSNNKYFSAIDWLFSHLGVEILESFIARDATLKNDYSRIKGKYLEDRLIDTFKKAFPEASILPGSLWYCSKTKKTYENDLIVLLNDFAFIIEAKSGNVTLPAKRGAPNRLFETLKELIVEPSEQAIRFESYLKENLGLHELKTKSGKINIVDSSKIKYYVPLGITLTNLGQIGCNLKKLKEAKIVDYSLSELAPSISITDLDIIFELLPLEAEKVHYLARRREFEAHVSFQGDEMDLFAFYLENGFNIGEIEYDEEFHINLIPKSKEIDPYIIGTSRGHKVKKPTLEKSKFWNDLLNGVANRKGNMWLMSSYILLNSTKEDQLEFERKLEALKRLVSIGKAPHYLNSVLFLSGPPRRRYAIVGFPYKSIDKETRDDFVMHILDQEIPDDVRGVLIIGQNLDKSHYPYSFLAGKSETNFFDVLELN